ncbi:uncharacterized protein LOC111719702 isoform X2 [Sarcophilus harrisii]|uniref:uncharacterized protein LOC111719702 isoform X2 n=2 Tax=Sarcophilus harrisii TaxID=9305 RepID=UPI001301D87B|nr:uncharacterized protein LOC111719702 isoform X2 [Sarcophilus harrisii]
MGEKEEEKHPSHGRKLAQKQRSDFRNRKSFSSQMGRRHRIFPKAELIQFPQNSLYRQTSSVLLPCHPHRISPFWEKEYQSRTELMSLLQQTSNTSQSSHRHYHKNVQEPTSWLKHSGNAPKMPHLNYRAVAAPLPRLHHLAKPASRHKHRTVAPVLPLPRTDIPTRKTSGSLIPIDQCLIPPLSLKHQYDFPSDSDHRLENSSGSDHLPKIFPACDHLSIEDLSLLNPKDPISTFSDHQTKVPLYKGHKSRDTPVPDTQIKTSGPLARPPTQGTKVLPRPRRRIKATNALLGLFNLDPVLHPLAKSLPFTNWTKGPNFRSPSPNHQAQTQALKTSHSDLQLKEAMSFLQYLEHRPRPLAVPTSHLNRKNRSTTVCKYNNRQLHGPCSLAHVSVQTEQDNWETKLLRKYLLDSRPCSPEEKPSTLVKIDKEPFEAIFQGKAIQDLTPSNLDLKTGVTSEPTVHVSIQTEPDTWVTISQRLELQEKLPSCPEVDVDMISEPIVHVSIQTELNTWETISPETDLQETFSSSPDVETDITPEPTVHVSIQTELDTLETISPDTDLQETFSSSPDLETDKILEPLVHTSMQTEVDNWETTSPETDLQETLPSSPDLETNKTLEPPVHASIQTELDTWETISPEIDQEEIFVTGQDENIIPLDSSPQDITLSGPHQRTTPPSSPMSGAEHTPDSNALVPLHQELERWKPPPQEIDHLDIFSSSLEMDTSNVSGPTVKESVPIKEMYWEIILAMLLGLSNHQAITLTDEKHETAHPLDLDNQERIFSSPDEAKTPLPSPKHQIEDISNPDAQATLKQKLEEWATLSEETNLCNTLTFTTESHSEKTPVLSDVDDHISDGIEKETIEIIDIMPLRIEVQEANQIVEDHWAITPLSPDNSDQENAVPASDHQPTPLLTLDQEQEAEDTAHDPVQDLIVQTDQESGEITPLRTDLVATFLTDQDNEATMPPVDIKPKEPAQLVLESQIIPSFSPDQQTEDIPDLSSQVSLQPGSGPCDTMSSGTELQNIILVDQDQRIIPPLNLDNEEMTLLSSNQCTIHPPSPPDRQSEVAEDLNSQATSPRDLEYSAKLSEGREYDTPSSSASPSITISSISENETESGTESTHASSTSPGNVDDEEEMPPSPDKTISSSSSNHQIEAPTGRDHQPETELSSDHQDEVESGLPHQLHSVQKKQTKLHLNYIKPYTIEGGTISDKTAHAIINSIPQKRIKNDICKDVPLPLDEYNSCEYIVCLICASWIPDGCPHEGMKYPCEAQLLAVPIPIPMCEEEIDIKFVFKCPEATVSSLFSTSSTHSCARKSSEGAESFISDTMLPVPSRPKWFHFILGKSLPQWKKDSPRSPEPLLDKVFEEGSISKEGEKAKTHRTSFRSLLERFQWRQKETK